MSKKHFTFVGTRLFREVYLISFPQGEETKFAKVEKTTFTNPTFLDLDLDFLDSMC